MMIIFTWSDRRWQKRTILISIIERFCQFPLLKIISARTNITPKLDTVLLADNRQNINITSSLRDTPNIPYPTRPSVNSLYFFQEKQILPLNLLPSVLTQTLSTLHINIDVPLHYLYVCIYCNCGCNSLRIFDDDDARGPFFTTDNIVTLFVSLYLYAFSFL